LSPFQSTAISGGEFRAALAQYEAKCGPMTTAEEIDRSRKDINEWHRTGDWFIEFGKVSRGSARRKRGKVDGIRCRSFQMSRLGRARLGRRDSVGAAVNEYAEQSRDANSKDQALTADERIFFGAAVWLSAVRLSRGEPLQKGEPIRRKQP
jgi:hypothetical protein